ncbi:hypothetical protein SOPP22_15740 [Shewanella sp. OPT22]|nr:hypothetical protein SOPP22_15740 [Shewanella sp. OPT22]
MLSKINKTPQRALITLFTLVLLFVVGITAFWDSVSNIVFPNTTVGLYNRGFWENVLVEAHGLLFDILIIGVIVVWLDTKRAQSDEKVTTLNNLSDVSYLDLPEVNLRKVGMIHRLNNLDVFQFSINQLVISGARVIELTSKFSSLNQLKAKKTEITSSNFINTQLIKSDFSESLIRTTKFLKCEMKKTVFIDSQVRGVDFTDSNLERAVFINADLQNAIFKGCNLREINFENANLRNVNLKGVKHLNVESLLKAKNIDYLVIDDEIRKGLKSRNIDAKGL